MAAARALASGAAGQGKCRAAPRAHLGESLLDGNVIDHPVADEADHVARLGHHGRSHRLGQRLQQHKQGRTGRGEPC